jgi:ABC-2 type transport system ATP-binding protein
MIIIKDLCFNYPKKKDFALSEISCEIKPSEIFALLGLNGAGKTTLIRILSGLIIPQSGRVTVCGHDTQLNEYEARKSIGLVLGDERTFYFRLSGAQNLEFFGGLYGIKRARLKKRVMETLEIVGLQDDAKLQYMRYSSGMKKRLSMARALLHNPPVLLLDEPNSGVDPRSAKTIREIIFNLKKENRTMLLTTHDMEEAEKMSDRIGFLKEGKLIKIGSLEEFKAIIRKRRLEIEFDTEQGLIGATALENIVRRITDFSPLTSVKLNNSTLIINYNGSFDMSRVLGLVAEEGLKTVRTNTIGPSLEDIFIKLAG